MSELIRPIDINEEMRQSYLSYAMSVIVSRALPDARDGLKPVQRRILYAMHDMGLRPDQSYKKSARVVGEVLGKYHPHGDQSVYDAMVRLAQSFSMRYPLVDGQGNFGSLDGDEAAAMRYTEARMTAIGHDMLQDLEKGTVNYGTNFDDTLKEPTVLPATIPSLLVNGSSGIAVGMSTNIPPHNLGEVINGLTYLLDQWEHLEEVSIADLMTFIKGPDFPTGGMIFRYEDDGVDLLAKAYASGRGRLLMRGTAQIEQSERNKFRIVITSLPYQTSKPNFMERVASLHRDSRLEGLTDLRDESDRNGMRIVVELSRSADPETILRQLYKLTSLQSTLSIIMVALVKGEPRVLTLKQALRIYLDHRLEVVRRRSEHDLAQARDRAHLLEGLIIASNHLDKVISLIRHSETVEAAREGLMKKFKLSDVQARAILEMPLRRLTTLEQQKLQGEYQGVQATINHLESLLADPKKMRSVVKEELQAVKAQYGDARQTPIVEKSADLILTSADLVEDKKCWVVIGENGTVGRMSQLPKMPAKPNETPQKILPANTLDTIYFAATNGEAVSRRVYELAESAEWGEGVHWTEQTALARGATFATAFVLPAKLMEQESSGYLSMATVGGVVKRVRVADLPPVTDQSFTLIRVDDQDALGWVSWSSGNDELLLATAQGQAIRFPEDEIRPMGLPAGGVAGIKVKNEADGVIGMIVISADQQNNPQLLVWSITDNGAAKASPLAEYPVQKRYGQGVVNMKLPNDAREVSAIMLGQAKTSFYIRTKRNIKKSVVNESAVGNRQTKPKAINGLAMSTNNKVMGIVENSPEEPISNERIKSVQQLSLI